MLIKTIKLSIIDDRTIVIVINVRDFFRLYVSIFSDNHIGSLVILLVNSGQTLENSPTESCILTTFWDYPTD